MSEHNLFLDGMFGICYLVRSSRADTAKPPQHTHKGIQCVLALESHATLDVELCGLGEPLHLYLLQPSGKRMLLQVPCAFFIP